MSLMNRSELQHCFDGKRVNILDEEDIASSEVCPQS